MTPFNKPRANMTQDEFNQLVSSGRKLVVLDELVLDLGSFISRHPGGRFVLKQNIGRDVSKYFYGGYSLEGNLGAAPAQGYRHSNYARIIVNQLAIATF
jgi:cytochrome b involved in lipid metabolism